MFNGKLYLPCVVLISFLSLSFLSAQTPPLPQSPKHEVRAVWVTTVSGLDWPKTTDRIEQQRSLQEIVAQAKAANFNTIFFQVRGRGDAVYRSLYEPWAQSLTGTWGKDPGWDPLQFILDEAHAVGLEVHAWFNTFLVKSGPNPPDRTPPHLMTLHPDWGKRLSSVQTGGQDEWWLDPGLPQVRAYLIKVVMDIVRRYDVDGVHFDFIRYPGPYFPDEITYGRYGSGMPKDQWRRENINAFVRSVYDSIRSARWSVKVGSTPIGIYTSVPNGEGLQSYHALYQDSRLWLQEKKHDYLVPQVYWTIGSGNPDFESVVRDWANNTNGRHVYIGIGAYKPAVFKTLPVLIDVTRRVGLHGNAFFRYEHISQWWRVGERYQVKAVIPPMPWKDPWPPLPPQNIQVGTVGDGQYSITWSRSPRATDGDEAKRYVVYRSPSHPVDISDPANIVVITTQHETSFVDIVLRPISTKYYYAVTALDKLNNESEPSNEKAVTVTQVTRLFERLTQKKYAAELVVRGHGAYASYALDEWATVNLNLLDGAGSPIRTLVEAIRGPGKYVESFNAGNIPAGSYFLEYRLGGVVVTKPLRITK